MGLTNSNADLTDTYSHNAFGAIRERTTTTTSTQPFQYVGSAYDSTTRLYKVHARTHDAGLGRFMSKDPVAGLAVMPQTLNPYAYGVNGPLAYPDPSGTCIGPVAPACVAAAPIAGRVALAIGADYAMNAAVSATHYMVTRPEDKPFSLEDFAYTVGGEALDLTIADLKNPLTLLSPAHKYDKVGDILRVANKDLLGRTILSREKTQVNTYLDGGRATLKSIFRHLTKGQRVDQQTMSKGGVRRFNEDDSVQIRYKADGTTNLDLKGRGERGLENVHDHIR